MNQTDCANQIVDFEISAYTKDSQYIVGWKGYLCAYGYCRKTLSNMIEFNEDNNALYLWYYSPYSFTAAQVNIIIKAVKLF